MNLLELTSAYAGFLSGGRSIVPIGWTDLRLRGEDTMLMSVNRNNSKQVIDQYAAGALVYMLREAVVTGTGKRAQIDNWEVAGKTGTTQGAKDAWFVGFTSEYVMGVWMGYDDNTSLEGVTGGGLPAEVWANCMTRILEGRKPTSLPMISPEEYTKRGIQDDREMRQDAGNDQLSSRSLFKRFLKSLFND